MPAKDMFDEAITIGAEQLHGKLQVPDQACGMVLMATASAGLLDTADHLGIAAGLRARGLGTLMLELMGAAQTQGRNPVLDLPLLGDRVLAALRWLNEHRSLLPLPLGLMGLGQGASAALLACARAPQGLSAVVAHEGRPELAGAHLRQVRTPALWITEGRDTGVLELKRYAFRALAGPKHLEVLASPDGRPTSERLNQAATELASQWFAAHLPRPH